MSSIRGTTTKLCPPRRFSRSSAVRTLAASKGARKVRIGRRRAGGLAITLTSCMPTIAACRVRGIGVAVMRQQVPAVGQVAQPRLQRRAELLLLVDDHQAQVGEGDLSAGDGVGADDDRGLARRRSPPATGLGLGARRPAATAAPPRCPCRRTAAGRSGNAAAPARWSARRAPPAARSGPRRRRRAAPPRSCRSPRRRRPAGPSAGRTPGPPAPPRSPRPGRASRDRRTARRSRA